MPETPRSSADWPFPFPAPGRPKQRSVPPRTAYRYPYSDMRDVDATPVAARHVRSPLPAGEFKARLAAFCDDVGLISIDDPALAHEREEILWVYPHARTLVCLIGAENRAAMQSRYLPTANHALYECEERVFEMGRRAVRVIESLGGAGLTTTIGWPQEVSQRWADKIWPLSHKLVAQAAGLGVIGISRNFLHRELGAYCLIDTVLTNLDFDERLDEPIEADPCVHCNLCVAACPTDAIQSDGEFDFMACYNHTYRDSIPGFMDLVRDLAEAKPGRFARRWTDAEIAALWQSLAFRVEYRCFNCVSVCPADALEAFHGDKQERRRVLDEQLKPLDHARRVADQQFVIDTPSARERHDIPPGHWRTPQDPTRPGHSGVRLVELSRLRSTNIEAVMRNLSQTFRAEEADGLAFSTQFDFRADGGGLWWARIGDGRCQVGGGAIEAADLVVRCPGALFVDISRGLASPPLELLRGRLRLAGRRRLFLAFPRLFGLTPGHTIFHQLAWRLRRALRR
jgi:Fe-S-cluster-containing hydrogenase component 2